jgi:acyl-homoserine-lactone acylase
MKRSSRPLIRILLILVLLLLVAVTFILMPQPVNLGAYRALGAKYDVHILRDTWGVPHIFGKTDPDASFGLAYAHSEDDFLTIQQTLLAARGRLASVYGKDAAANDYMVQLLRIWDVVNTKYESDLAPDSRLLFEAYAAGLNYYAALHAGQVLSPDLFPVTGKDIVAASVEKSPLFFDLDKTLGELFADTRQGELSPTPGISFLDPLCGSCPSWKNSWFDSLYGSNTLAVGPARSNDGSTYLAVNSHQPWEGPVTWYEAHVHSEQGWDMVGALFPATPVIVHGHNQNLGWAFTVNSPDLTDVYVLDINPQDKNQYRFDGQWRNLEVRQAPIKVKILGRISWTVKQEVLWSVYGPVVRRPHGTYALRYAGFGRVDIFQQLYRMNKAANFEEWQGAMRGGGLPCFNVGYADKDGNIYYLYNALLPVRKEGYDWSKYLPGDTSQDLWTDYLPFDKLPQVFNPPSGFIQNANSTPYQTTAGPGNPNPAEFSPTLGIETRMSNRALRTLELFGADTSISFNEFEQYKFDKAYSAQSDMPKIVQMLVDAPVSNDPDVQAGIKILANWNLQADRQSTGATLAIFTIYNLAQSDPNFKVSPLVGNVINQASLESAYIQAVKTVKEKYGRVDVPWEQANRLARGTVNLGLEGGPDTLRAIYGKLQPDGRLKGFQGDSYILLAEWDPQGKVHSFSIHQYGSATLDTKSPHYADQSQLFAEEQLKPVWLEEAEIRAHLERDYQP